MPAEEDGRLSAHMSREFTDANIEQVAGVVLPDALRNGNLGLVTKCEEVLKKHGMECPNHLTGGWEPADVPHSEVQLREMFAHRMPDFGFKIIRSRDTFPDWLLMSSEGLYVRAEVELRSSSFFRHGHDEDSVDLIVCWEHDAPVLNVPVLEWFVERMYGEPEKHQSGQVVWPSMKREPWHRLPKRRVLMFERREDLMRGGAKKGEATKQVANEFGVATGTVLSNVSAHARALKS